MGRAIGNKDQSASQDDAGLKRRGLIRFGTLITAFTGASAIAALNADGAQAAPGGKNSDEYVPVTEKAAASGVATLDIESRIPAAQIPDLSATYGLKDGRTICWGFSREDVIETLNAAEAKGRGSIAYFPAGVYDVVTTLSLSGYSCQIRGEGAAGTKANPTGTVFYASAQRGPVLNFDGYVIPTDVMTARISHGGFMVRGSGVADPTKNNAGICMKTMSSATFSDIAIRDTGGPCLEFVSNPGNGVYLCDFERIMLNTPVGAAANDVPYFVGDECNGNRFRSFGFRSMSAAGDCGVSGAIVITSNAQYASSGNLFEGFWFENIHVPSGGTLVSIQANRTQISDMQMFDVKKELGANNTSVFRLTAPTVSDYGGNRISGTIPGSEPATFDTGVDVRQSRNSIVGVKGYKGANVTIAASVTNTYIDLAGAVSGATNPAVIDNSGNLTNTYLDRHLGIETYPNRVAEDTAFSFTSRRRFFDALAPNNGGIALGKSGAAICALGGSGSLFYTPGPSQFHIFNDGTGAATFQTTATGISLATNKSVRLAVTTTPTRPSAVSAGKGALIYDETISKPIWSDGTVWRDALGAVV